MRSISACVFILSVALSAMTARSEEPWVWRFGQPQARLIAPNIAGPMERIVQVTLNSYFLEAYGWTIPTSSTAEQSGLNIVVGNEANNPVIRALVDGGLELDRSELGEEGFRIVTYESEDRRFVIVTANSPIGLKHGCQELTYFHLPATADEARIDWPMNIKKRPQFPCRAVYILPCWSAHDSVDHWKRVLRFHSELTLNRNYFWLAGFPLLEEYGGEYKGTDLAEVSNVRSLIELCHSLGMKFYIGGGWFTWHHEKIAGGSIARGIQYYRDMLTLLPEADGIYLEPSGEGKEIDETIWKQHVEALKELTAGIWRTRPNFEFAIAIGRFNAKAYRQAVHEIDEKRIYWVWGWGDPVRDKALAEHPLVLRWHTVNRGPSDWHGSTNPPKANEIELPGFFTSWDPGQGFGNPWTGRRRGPTNAEKPLEFHPYTMPLLSHQYWFRERCWDLGITEDEFAARLARRIFDADMPVEAIRHYLTLAGFCPDPKIADERKIAEIAAFVAGHAPRGTPRNRDTLARMREAIDELGRMRKKAKATGGG